MRAKAPGWQHATRMHRRGVRISLPKDGDANTAFFDDPIGCKDSLVFAVADIQREERITEIGRELLCTLLAIGEFPMAGRGIGLQQFEAIDDILAFGAQCTERPMESVAAIEENNTVLP